MKKSYKVETYVKRLFCDKCGKEMEDTGVIVRGSSDEKLGFGMLPGGERVYKCPNCGYTEYCEKDEVYPIVCTKEIEVSDGISEL